VADFTEIRSYVHNMIDLRIVMKGKKHDNLSG